MTLRIESPQILRLINQISALTGEGAETVVAVALRERLELLDEAEAEAQRWREVYALVRELGATFREAGISSVDHGELLYDENGFPREGELSEYELRFYYPERYTLADDVDGGEAWRSRSKDQKPSE
jgi:hypothetical protein